MIAGVGFRASATAGSLLDALAQLGVPVGALALPGAKSAHPAVSALRAQGWQIIPVSAAQMAAQTTLTHSPAALRAHGTGSVAEACALAVAGPGARLAAPRVISADRRATAALALTGDPL